MSTSTDIQVYGGLGPLALGVTWTLGSLATVLLALRFYVLFGMQRRLGLSQLVWVSASWVSVMTIEWQMQTVADQ